MSMMFRKYLFPLILLPLFFVSCGSAPVAVVPEEEPFVLPELFPPEKEVVVVEEVVEEEEEVEVEPVYVVGRIAEIEVVQGVQKYLYIKLPEEAQGIKPGLVGEVFSDSSFETSVGNFKIVQEFPGYYYAEILDLIYTIDRNATVRIEVPPEE
ncbi:hypothetical protein [Sediminispirochaeta bajacaliforniensis]|uniref:hypothetical protein n=1 Tax=Sediminispirochaeta bajacaliforniensis TaxID=148 RepID=UPI00035E53CB|nr:hypothetical protein [Sediminispirochaeta bajacaliforniensis]